MEKTVTDEMNGTDERIRWGHRPLLSRRFTQLQRWVTPERITVAWQLAKKAMASRSRHPAYDLALDIGVAPQTLSYWRTGTHRPSKLPLLYFDAALTRILGKDWPEQVEQVLESNESDV